MRAGTVTARREHWTRYLRLLDADAEGVGAVQVMSCLGIDEETLETVREQARRLRDFGYCRIRGLPERDVGP